jgi:RNA polymerase sigma-70 factor (ECF subfamily)
MDVNDPAPDERILRDAVLRGDDAAWRVLYDRYFDAIHAYIRWNGRALSDRTDDLVQECWMIAVKTIRRFDPSRSTFGTWLRGIAHNVLRNEVRKRRPASEPLEHEPVAASHEAPSFAVAAAMAELPENYREVLAAKYCDGLAVVEIAAATGRTAKAVESLLTRAREAFRQIYRPEDKP